ncbi:MAG: hypothetical protein ACE5GC_02055 [Acidimicrobiia bacterium]
MTDGFASVQWMMGLGLIVVPAAVIVLTLAPWYERAGLGALAAQEAARTVAVAPTWDEGVVAAEALIARIAAARCPEEPQCLSVAVRSSVPGRLERGGTVTAEVGVTLPRVVIPFVGSFGAVEHRVTSVEAVDRYRSLD